MLQFYRVSIIESERGWGQRIDETKYFTDKSEAEAFVKKYNSKNTAETVPDWYMRADGPTTEYVDDQLAQMIVDSYKNNKKRKKNEPKQCNSVRANRRRTVEDNTSK